MTEAKAASTKWTDEEADFLRKNYRTYSCRVIAETLGKSRNAIIGKASRLGLTLPYDQVFGNPYGKVLRVEKMRKIVPDVPTSADDFFSRNLLAIVKEKNEHFKKPKPVFEKHEPLENSVVPLNGVGVSLWDAKSSHCRWVLGEPKAMMYCGHTVHKGSSYCPTHYAVSKNPSGKVKK